MNDLKQMQTICEALYAKAQREFAKLCAEEARLRAELNRLGAMGQAAQADAGQLDEMRALGADVIWQGWLGRAKTTLNMSLAQVLANKEWHIADVRKAYGKLLVVQELLKDVQAQQRRKMRSAALLEAVNVSVLKTFGDQ